MSQSRPVRTPLLQILDEFRRGPLPFLVWMLAVAGVASLFMRRTQHYEFAGIARARQFEISSPAEGSLIALTVDLYEDVEAGQIVAQLDDTLLAAQMETLKATIKQLETQMIADTEKLRIEESDREGKTQADMSDIRSAEDRLHLEALAIKTEIETDRVALQKFDVELGRMLQMLEANAVSKQEHDIVKLERDTIARRIDENSLRLAKTEAAWRDAQRQRNAYVGKTHMPTNLDITLQPYRDSILVQERLIDELAAQRKWTLLRAPISGRVTLVACEPGQAVAPGEAILMISEHHASEIIGYIADSSPVAVTENTPVRIARASAPAQVIEATVRRVSSSVELVPQQFWTDLNHPRYGRPFIVSMLQPASLTPGEKILIRARR